MTSFLLGAIVFTLLFLLATVGVQDLPDNSRIANFDKTVLLAMLTSVAASGAFFIVIETFRLITDKSQAQLRTRLARFETEFGLIDIFHSKSQNEAIQAYTAAVADSTFRIWAIGISNNQFLDQHSHSIKVRRTLYPDLDLRVYFFDPDATVSSPQLNTDQTDTDKYKLITLFDFPKSLYTSQKRSADVGHFSNRMISDRSLGAKVFYLLIPAYFSAARIRRLAFPSDFA